MCLSCQHTADFPRVDGRKAWCGFLTPLGIRDHSEGRMATRVGYSDGDCSSRKSLANFQGDLGRLGSNFELIEAQENNDFGCNSRTNGHAKCAVGLADDI